ncbi:class I SAM-dependent methyltransferase [Alkaliphilus peptidifermentans]|uniref:Methyltransferase domain-containing protein n=1 Tax=Alkaliphilus peptidifermentans DSM 18978 TaxID=1120976 RepID=A0A1G5ESX6_9FIRM|nr:class I SAM-dependent methyltransferase [Alkaliphilus peptidifermentans]SCY30096.1 Methyltransferase domain-containing protein [Alkaliphilus peptidifermentans DSM 18978]
MLNNLIEYLKKPELYAKSTSKFWDDEHISEGMLESHLNPEGGASRPHRFMDKSVEWIAEVTPVDSYAKVLDLGCGPGLYAERMYGKGYQITGIDFSKRSIEYAISKAKAESMEIEYIYKNYLEIDYDNEFDLIILIYCDLGALTVLERNTILKKVYKSLKPGGRFIFDIHTPKQYEGRKEENTWYVEEKNGFFRPCDSLCLESHYIYENNIRLDQYVVVGIDDRVDVIRVWDHFFTLEDIKAEVNVLGFKYIEAFSDVAGAPYCEESKTMCIILEK